MENRWSERDEEQAVERATRAGFSLDVALRTYSTRLLGVERRLVLHGGGNTSVKTMATDVYGDRVRVICVKGSGWDMATIEPPGLPAVRLDPLLRLTDRDSLSDEDMVGLLRANLLDANAPNPSVETLLHAFLPHKFIDHTHANAILALVDQPNGERICADVFGASMAVVPYVMPGFQLAKATLAAWQAAPDAEGVILLKHGIFTFGETAKEAYDRMIDKVSLAEDRIAGAGRRTVAGMPLPKGMGRHKPKSFHPGRLPARLPTVAQVAPLLRGALAGREGDGAFKRWVLAHRRTPDILDFAGGSERDRYARQGTATPDHIIRIKRLPLILPPPDAGDLGGFRAVLETAVADYAADYRAYFERHNARVGGIKKPLDPLPRIVLVPGIGIFGLGASRREAEIALDLMEANVDVITAAENIGTYEVIPEADAFDMEYWSLEQAKLGRSAPPPLAGQVVVVTGGGSGIGAATARAFRRAGAEVVVFDVQGARAEKIAESMGGLGVVTDVTRPEDVADAFDRVVETLGGVDVVVSNAGAAWQGRIGEVDDHVLRDSFELNFWAHQTVARNAVRIMQAQRTGGVLLFNVSKQALNPGADFGPYGLPKAATLALMRQYAVDYGRDGIRTAAINADRIRTRLLDDEMIASRAKARGVSEEDYMAGNLLGEEVTAEDVARAFVHLALDRRTTAAILTVDGGNIAAAPR